MLPRRNKTKKRIRLQFRGIKLLSHYKKKPPPPEQSENENDLLEMNQVYSRRAQLLD